MRQTIKRKTDNYDGPWKSAIENLFPYMIQFFHPKLYGRIDWDKGFVFLNDELRKITRPKAREGTRFVDKLVCVHMLDGTEQLLFIHIEVQSDRDDAFPERMFVYYYRIKDKYGKRIVSLALLGDTDTNWRPNKYHHEESGCTVTFKFPMVKLLDYEQKWDKLERSRNPFALVVMAHLKAKRTAGDDQERARWKFNLLRLAATRKLPRKEVEHLIIFVDWLLKLPKNLDKQVDQELKKNEGGKEMAYVNRWELKGEKKGKLEGKLEGKVEGKLEMLSMLLLEKFGKLPAWALNKLESADLPSLEAWSKAVLRKNTLEEVFSP